MAITTQFVIHSDPRLIWDFRRRGLCKTGSLLICNFRHWYQLLRNFLRRKGRPLTSCRLNAAYIHAITILVNPILFESHLTIKTFVTATPAGQGPPVAGAGLGVLAADVDVGAGPELVLAAPLEGLADEADGAVLAGEVGGKVQAVTLGPGRK